MISTRPAVSSYALGLTLTALITIIYGVFCAPIARAQEPSPNPLTPATMTGAPPYSTHEEVREDVALASGGLHVYIPILSLKGKGGQTFNLGWAHDSHGINLQEYDQANGWVDGAGGLNPYNYITWFVSPDVLGYLTFPHLRASWLFLGNYPVSGLNYSLFCNANFVFRDEYGTSHSFYVSRDCTSTGSSNEQFLHTLPIKDSDDGAVMHMDASSPTGNIIVRTKDGTTYTFPPIQGNGNSTEVLLNYDQNFLTITDPNGNTITNNAGTITDSVGHTITLGGGGVQWTDSNGNSQTATITYGGTPGPNVQTNATTCTYDTNGQSVHQASFLYQGEDLANVGNLKTGMTLALPGGATTTLQFDQLGDITKITYPGGGYTTYTYSIFQPMFNLAYLNCYAEYREVATKNVCSSLSGSCSTLATTSYEPEVQGNGINLQTTVVDAANNTTIYNFYATNDTGSIAKNPRESDRFIYQGSSTLVKTIHTDYTTVMPAVSCESAGNCYDYALPYQVITTLNDVTPNLVSKVVTTYDTVAQDLQPCCQDQGAAPVIIDNPTQVQEYDFTSTVKRTTTNTWEKTGNYTPSTLHILDRLATKTVTDPVTTNASTTINQYDTLGNLLSATVGGTNATSLTTSYQRNSYGDVTLLTDPKTNTTNYCYDGSTTCPNSSTTDSYGLPTAITNALGQKSLYTYYPHTFFLDTAEDPNNQITTYTYDALGRPTNVAYPDGGSTTKLYVDTSPQSVKTSVAITSSLNKTTESLLDGLGREYQDQLTTDPGGTDYTDTTYDLMERVASVSNPHRSATSLTDGVTQYLYDELSRRCLVIRPDGTAATACPSTTAPVGDVSTVYAGSCTTVTDETGKARQSCVDGLGRMTSVTEDPSNLDYKTAYTYDGFNNLTGVTQTGTSRPRSFTYDGMSRLTKAVNPESGTISYSYTTSGGALCAAAADALCSKTAPSPNQVTTGTATATTTYTYDSLNRLTGKSYSDSYASNTPTPKALYAYDGNTLTGCTIAPATLTDSYPVGRRTSMCDGSGAAAWAHDKMGRVLQERRTINTVKGDYENDAFNLDGSIASATSLGYQVSYTYGGAGLPLTATHTTTNFLTGTTYAPPGQLTGGTLGSATGFAGFTINNAYNDRLQPILLSAAVSGQSPVFSECFDFHLGVTITWPTPCSFTRSTAGNNGNVYQIVNNRTSTRSQSFLYDALNRITSGESSGTQWGESYTLDAWGNMTAISPYQGKPSESFSATANTNNQLVGYGYDAAGNMILNGSTYAYDDENRLIWTSASSGYRYIYDGDGERVEKCVAATSTTACPTTGSNNGTLYWRGLGSDPLAETSVTGAVQNTYIFFNGQRIARSDSAGAIHYYFSDHLGTHGVVENATGTVCEQDIDYYPYGFQQDDYCPNVPQNYKFTGKERDSESGLDEFGARYYASSMGRFMIPDWAAKPTDVPYASFGNPQSLNLYSYVNNNPTTTRDPDGHCPDGICQNIATMSPDQVNQQGQAFSDAVVGAAKGLWNMVAGTWNTGAELLNAQTAASSPTGTPYGVPTLPMAQPTNVTQAVSGAVAQTAVVISGAIGESKPAVPEEIPAGPSARPTAAQQSAINEMGEAHGCSTCGATTPGTKSGNWVGDHQPPTALNKDGGPQVYKPQCLQCSRQQGGQVAAAVRAAKKQDQPQQ